MKNCAFRLVRTSTLLVMLVFLCSCAAPTAPFELRSGQKIPTSERLVIGRVSVLLKGRPVENWGSSFVDRVLTIYLLKKGTASDEKPYTLKRDGMFQWKLQPGKYVITGFAWGVGTSMVSGRIWAEFEVAGDESNGQYLGTLVIDMRASRLEMKVEDNKQADMQRFATEFPEFKDKNFTTALMRLEENP